MSSTPRSDSLPAIPGKRYFTIGEVSALCKVEPHVLRHWEKEFEQLSPDRRRGSRRYYRRQDILVIRQIRALRYDQGFTTDGARRALAGDAARADRQQAHQLIRQTIAELEDVLRALNGAAAPSQADSSTATPSEARAS